MSYVGKIVESPVARVAGVAAVFAGLVLGAPVADRAVDGALNVVDSALPQQLKPLTPIVPWLGLTSLALIGLGISNLREEKNGVGVQVSGVSEGREVPASVSVGSFHERLERDACRHPHNHHLVERVEQHRRHSHPSVS